MLAPVDMEALAHARAFKYRGEDRSLLYKHVLSPIAQFFVDYATPWWLACVWNGEGLLLRNHGHHADDARRVADRIWYAHAHSTAARAQ